MQEAKLQDAAQRQAPEKIQSPKPLKSVGQVVQEFLVSQKDDAWREYAKAWDSLQCVGKYGRYHDGEALAKKADVVFATEKCMILYKAWLKAQIEGLKSGELVWKGTS